MIWKTRLRVVLVLAACLGLGGCARSFEVGAGAQGAPPLRRAPEGDVVPVELPAKSPSGSAAPEAPATAEARAEVGRPYRDFSARRLEGGQLRLSDFVGPKAVVLQFWGVRCAPCLAEMAFLSEMQALHAQRLQVIGVNTDRAPDEQLRLAMASRAIAPAFPVVADPDFSISSHYTQWLVPVSVLIDRKGIVRSIHTGYNVELASALRAEIEAVLTEE